MSMRAALSTHERRFGAVRGFIAGPSGIITYSGATDESFALAEARALLASTEPAGDSSRGHVNAARLVSASRASREGANLRGALAEALATFIAD